MNKKYIIAVNQPYYPSVINVPTLEIGKMIYDNMKTKGEPCEIYLCEVIHMEEIK